MRLLTLNDVQFFLNDLTALAQLAIAILSLLAILIPVAKSLSISDKALQASYLLGGFLWRACGLERIYDAICDDQGVIPSQLSGVIISTGQLFMRLWTPLQNVADLLDAGNDSDSEQNYRQEICLGITPSVSDDLQLVSGLVNTGNSCFMNSVLQALSSLPRLHTYLNSVQQQASTFQVSVPVTRSLRNTLRGIAKPIGRRSSFRPKDIVAAMSCHKLVINREQQDAQELFQLIASTVDTEIQELRRVQELGDATTHGLKGLLRDSFSFWSHRVVRPEKVIRHCTARPHNAGMSYGALISNSPFTGLLASRVSCMQCGYTEAIRHFSFNNVQLILPKTFTVTLDECLRQYTSLEYLNDAACRKCSLINTLRIASSEAEALKLKAKQTKKPEKKRELLTRMVTLEKRRREIEKRLRLGQIEDDFEQDTHVQRTISRLSTKQIMFAKPPKILCLHLSRSAFHPSGAVYKNTCQLIFPEYLDLSPYTTGGTLSTQPQIPISDAASNEKNSLGKIRYKLMSTIVHFGSHSYGHFIAFKRRVLPNKCLCHKCVGNRETANENEVWEGKDAWYRISDSAVDICTLDTVLQSNPYMLLYELEECQDSDDDVDDLMVAAGTRIPSESVEHNAKMEEPYTYPADMFCSDPLPQEALRIANALLMDDQLSAEQSTSEPKEILEDPVSGQTDRSIHWKHKRGSNLSSHHSEVVGPQGWPEDRRHSTPLTGY